MVAPGECSSLWLRGSFHLAAGAVVQGAAGRCRAGRNPTASAAGLSPEMGSNDGLSSSNAQASASCHTTRTGVRSDPHLPTRLPQSQLTIRHGEEVDAPAALVAPDLVSGVRELAPPSSGNPPTTGRGRPVHMAPRAIGRTVCRRRGCTPRRCRPMPAAHASTGCHINPSGNGSAKTGTARRQSPRFQLPCETIQHYPTLSVPSMPASRCPGTEQK
jgi:hypothetical protein